MGNRRVQLMYPRRSTLFGLMIVAIGFRLAPYVLHNFGVSIDPGSTVYPWNFSPILPLCLFGAACYRSCTTAWLAPLTIYGGGRSWNLASDRQGRLGDLRRAAGVVSFGGHGCGVRILFARGAIPGRELR